MPAPREACARTSHCIHIGSVRRIGTNASSSTMLWASPGSGTSWLRVLLELAIGQSTNSVFRRDRSEAKSFCPRTPMCEAMVVKSHHGYGSECNGKMRSWPKILLVRNPYAAIWSEYQRVAAVTMQRLVDGSSAVLSNHTHVAALKTLRIVRLQHLLTQARIWRNITSRQLEFASNGSRNALWAFYEELSDPSRRIAALRRITAFAGMEISESRAACAFNRSDVDHLHRSGTFTASEALDAAETDRARRAIRSARRRTSSNTSTSTEPTSAHDVLWKTIGSEASFFGYARMRMRAQTAG